MLAIAAAVTRLLPPDEAGTVLLALSLTAGLGVISELGLRRVANRVIAGSMTQGAYGRTRAAALRCLGVVALSGFVVGALVASPVGTWVLARAFPSTELSAVAGLVGLLIWMRALSAIRADVFRGFQDFKWASIFDRADGTVLAALGLAVPGVLLPFSIGMDGVLLLAAVAWVPGLLVGGLLLWRRLRSLSGSGAAGVTELLGYGWPLMLNEGALLLLNQADLWIVGGLLSSEDVATYAVALRLLGLVSFLLVISNGVLPPLIAELQARAELGRMQHLVRTTATVAAVPALLLVGVFILTGGPLLTLLFGDFYAAAWSTLGVLCLGQLANVWAGSASLVLVMGGWERRVMRVTLVSATLMVGLSVAGALLFGVVGVAAASALSTSLKQLWMWQLVRRIYDVRTDVRPIRLAEARSELARLRSAISS